MLFTESILSERHPDSGTRISVMSRHTLNDGVTPDPRIIPASYDEHISQMAPAPKLIGAYYKRGLPWEEFEQMYIDQIRQADSIPLVQALAYRALRQNLTLLCIEETPERCHRRLLAQECLIYQPTLTLIHR